MRAAAWVKRKPREWTVLQVMETLIVAGGAALSLLIVAAVFYWIARESRDVRKLPVARPVEPHGGLHVSESPEPRN